HSSDYTTYRRALSGRLDRDRQWARRSFSCVNHFPWRSRYSVFSESFFSANFVERDLARGHALAGVCDSATLQNFLDLAIFAKGSVDRDEREIDIVRQLEILVSHIYFNHFGA